MNIFEKASRNKYRFSSIKGDLTVEQLWDLPLQAKGGFDLDSVAKAANSALKNVTEESFVATQVNPAKADLELKLEIVKYVIGVRQQENEAKLLASARQDQVRRLEELLNKKKDQAFEGMTAEEVQAQLDALRKG